LQLASLNPDASVLEQLLLLDGPNNHLDLPSLYALEGMLRCYHGAMLVVSHDDVFMNQLGLTHRLLVTDGR
jgi:ATPase subunit of ABC transporter with duplicated ATPase domains